MFPFRLVLEMLEYIIAHAFSCDYSHFWGILYEHN